MSAEFIQLLIVGLVLTVPYLPLLVLSYWFTHVRRQLAASRQVVRSKELAFFFMRNLNEPWKLGSHLLVSVGHSLVLGTGAFLSAISLVALLHQEAEVTLQFLGWSLTAIERYVCPIFFGFLGAYLFMLQTTLRRYLDDDLGIDTYPIITWRVIYALIISFVAGFVLPAQYKEANAGTVLVYGAAFIYGARPEDGFETLYRIVTGWLGEKLSRKDSHSSDLQDCLGLDRVRLARLDVENIKTVQDMAYVEIERLAQETRFDLQSIFHWVDRAIFYSQLKDSPMRPVLETYGIRTFTAFEKVYRDAEARQGVQVQLAHVRDAGESGDLDLAVVYTAMMRVPNTHIVRLFMRYKAMQVAGSFEAANRAHAFERMAQYDRAAQEYGEALQRNPLDPTLLVGQGRAWRMMARQEICDGNLNRGQVLYEQALQNLGRAIDILPSFWEAYLERALTLLSIKPYLFEQAVIDAHLTRAAQDLQIALKHNTDEMSIVNWLGWVYLERGDYAGAEKVVGDALPDMDDQSPVHTRATAALLIARALVFQAQNKPKKEQKKLLEKAHAQITNAQALMPRSSLLFATQAFYHHVASPGSRQVERLFELALGPGDVQPSSPDVDVADPAFRLHLGSGREDELYERWGELCWERGEYDTALACFTQALALNPVRVSTYMKRGALYQRLGDLEMALADYDFLIQQVKCETADGYLARARVQSLLGMQRTEFGERAENDIEHALALAPDRPEPLLQWADWLRLNQDYDQAIEAYERAEERIAVLEAQEDGVSRDLWVRLDVGLGLTFSALADYAEARRVLRDADRRVGGEHGRPSALWIGWGVLDTLQNETPEMQMNARDAFVHLAEDPDLSAAGAANLAQVADALQAFAHAAGDQVLDRPSRILLTITRARVAALTGVPLSAVLEMVQSLQADISALSDDVRRLTLQRLLADLVELKKFV